MIDPRVYCENCRRYDDSSSNMCHVCVFNDFSGLKGEFSKIVSMDANVCYPLPDTVDWNLTALIESLAVAWHAVGSYGSSGIAQSPRWLIDSLSSVNKILRFQLSLTSGSRGEITGPQNFAGHPVRPLQGWSQIIFKCYYVWSDLKWSKTLDTKHGTILNSNRFI